MKKTSEDLVAWAKAAYANGWVYWYGTSGYKCTTGLLNSKTNQYPSHYKSSRRATYEQHIAEGRIAADCIGLFKSYAWDKDSDIETVGGKYGSNDHPDKSTKQALAACKVKGDISTIPEIPGLAVWTKSAGHIGVYVGNGEVIELKGYSDNCQWNKLADRTFTTWGLYPYVEYTVEQVALAKAAVGMAEDDSNASSGSSSSASKMYKLGDRTLSKGSKGEDVRELQEALNKLPYLVTKLEVDGDFGANTARAVYTFQNVYGISVDSKYGPESHKTLMAALADLEVHPEGVPAAGKKFVTIVSQKLVNLRNGDSLDAGCVTQVKSGTKLEYVATINGWHGVRWKNRIVWVSGQFSTVAEA